MHQPARLMTGRSPKYKKKMTELLHLAYNPDVAPSDFCFVISKNIFTEIKEVKRDVLSVLF